MKKLDLLLHFRDKLYLPHISFYENEIKSICHYSLCVNVCFDSLTMSWHLRLGHINKVRINALARDDLLPNIDKLQYPVCEPCLSEKMVKKSFSKRARSSQLLDIIHCNTCGPLNVYMRTGYEHFVTFIDDYNRYGYLY